LAIGCLPAAEGGTRDVPNAEDERVIERGGAPIPAGSDSYLTAEARARVEIDKQLGAARWVVQDADAVNLAAAQGVAVREFVLKSPHGRADYLLFVKDQAVGSIEAKPAGTTLTGVEIQSAKYRDGLQEYLNASVRPLPFAYEATGVETRFTNRADPEPRSRSLFWFHQPTTLAGWIREITERPGAATLRQRLQTMPALSPAGLWPAQARAIENLERSLREDRPRALVQMATGSGKTFTAVNVAYRLIKYANARRVLFLVDRAHLGRQTLKEFQQFTTPDDGRKFTELYNVQHLLSQTLDPVARVCISTIQRMYSILRGEPLAAELDEEPGSAIEPRTPVEVVYNPEIPIETFDVIIVDECHRSIYNLWRQVLEYFDAYLIGLTATPAKITFGFFNQNLVMEYPHEEAVADGVNVDFDVYKIRTEIGERGSTIDAGIVTGFRHRETREVRWEQLDEPLTYEPEQLDRKVVAKDQIRTIIRTFRDRLFSEIFPGRTEVPKTLIFAKEDSHAEDIVQIVREEFGKGNDFAVKITYKTTGKTTEDLIAEFRNSYNPRIAVTVDMIATGTDVKPLECLVFMRAVRSRTFFEQMKGRGVRVIDKTELQGVTPDAATKTRFVLVDAVGVTETPLMDSAPLERKPTVAFDRLLNQIALGARDPDTVSSVASRLARLARQITKDDRTGLEEVAGGMKLDDLVHGLVDALDPDRQWRAARETTGTDAPSQQDVDAAGRRLLDTAVEPLATNPKLREMLIVVRRSYEQAIDEVSKDVVTEASYSADAKERAKHIVESFEQFIDKYKDEITALQILYSRPYKQRLMFKDIKGLANAIAKPPYNLTPDRLWQAYQALEKSRVRGAGGQVLTDLVSLVRFETQQDNELVPFKALVDVRFKDWLLRQQRAGRTFTPEQQQWLEAIKDHVATSLTITRDDFDYNPFVERGGLGKAAALFGRDLDPMLEEITEALAA
jgi:type I restriction enzyme R subunit